MANPDNISGTPNVLPRPDFHFPGEIGRTYLDSDPAQFPKPVQAPEGAPDVSFSSSSTTAVLASSRTLPRRRHPVAYPGQIGSLNEGLRFNRFHTTALCSPTRAAPITGRNHHSAAFAGITELATGYDGYTCILPRSCGTVGEVLRQNGYVTAWIGKNHNTPTWETSAAGPFDRWANGLGFDYFYGFNSGDMNHWNPILFENRNLVPASTDPEYHLTSDIADKAIAWVIRCKASLPPSRSFSTSHLGPLIHRIKHRKCGSTSSRANSMGLGQVPRRDVRSPEKARCHPTRRETHCTFRRIAILGFAQRRPETALRTHDGGFRRVRRNVHHHMGRVIDAVKQMPGADNTLFIYIAGDNGSSAEGGIEGSLNENAFFNGLPEKWQDNLKPSTSSADRNTLTISRVRGHTR